MVSIKLEVVNIMTTSILNNLGTWKFPLWRGARFLRLSSVVCLPYRSIRVNNFCISLIIIYTPSKNNPKIHRNVSGRVCIIQVYGPDHMMVFFYMGLWIIVIKVDFYWAPIDTEMFFLNPVLTPTESHVPWLCSDSAWYYHWISLPLWSYWFLLALVRVEAIPSIPTLL